MSDDEAPEPVDLRAGAPWVVLEHLVIGGFEHVRAIASRSEMDAHTVALAMADAGLRVWLVDLEGDGDGPSVSRYVGGPGAAYLDGIGVSSSERGAGDELTRRGL